MTAVAASTATMLFFSCTLVVAFAAHTYWNIVILVGFFLNFRYLFFFMLNFFFLVLLNIVYLLCTAQIKIYMKKMYTLFCYYSPTIIHRLLSIHFSCFFSLLALNRFVYLIFFSHSIF